MTKNVVKDLKEEFYRRRLAEETGKMWELTEQLDSLNSELQSATANMKAFKWALDKLGEEEENG